MNQRACIDRAEREGGRQSWYRGASIWQVESGRRRRKAVYGNKRAEAEDPQSTKAPQRSSQTKRCAQAQQAQAQHAAGPGKRGSTTLAATVTGVLVAQGDPHQREVCALEGAANRCGRIDAAKTKAKTRRPRSSQARDSGGSNRRSRSR